MLTIGAAISTKTIHHITIHIKLIKYISARHHKLTSRTVEIVGSDTFIGKGGNCCSAASGLGNLQERSRYFWPACQTWNKSINIRGIFYYWSCIFTCPLYFNASALYNMPCSRLPEIKFFIKRPDLASFSDDKLYQSTALKVVPWTIVKWKLLSAKAGHFPPFLSLGVHPVRELLGLFSLIFTIEPWRIAAWHETTIRIPSIPRVSHRSKVGSLKFCVPMKCAVCIGICIESAGDGANRAINVHHMTTVLHLLWYCSNNYQLTMVMWHY